MEIEYSTKARYLGVILDQKLSWHAHVDSKIKEAKYKPLRIRNATGKIWGFPPILGRWIYHSISSPAVTYSALVWSKVCRFKGVQNDLNRLNQLARTVGGVFGFPQTKLWFPLIDKKGPVELCTLAEKMQHSEW